MSDLKSYVAERKKRDKAFAEGYDEGYEQFKIGVVLKQARESAGLTQEELAQRLKTKKPPYHGSKIMLRISNSQPWRRWPMPSVNGSK
jgi:hypothetical protein